MNKTIHIREAVTPEEVERFWQELHAYHARDVFPDPAEEDRAYFLDDSQYRAAVQRIHDREGDRCYYLLFRREGRDIGFALTALYPSEDGKCFVMEFCVLPEFRGGGTGTACARLLLDWAADRGAQYGELNAADLRRRKIDFIISTVPLELDYPAVCISPSLLEPDRAVLKDAITQYSQNRAEPEPAVQPVQDTACAGSKLQYYARLTRSMTGLLEHLTIQPVKVPGSRAALIHAAAQLFCPQEADARLVEQQLRRRETLGDTYIKSLYALLLHCRTSAVKDCRLGYLQAQPPVYEPGRIVLGALVLLAPDDGNGVPVEVMQNVSGQLIETPRLMEALRTSVCIRM